MAFCYLGGYMSEGAHILHHMGFSYLLCYTSEGGHICTRPEVEGKCALPREDNIADMKKPM